MGTNDAQIAKRDLGTDTNSVLVSTRPQGVYGITVAAGFVYWANQLTPALSKNPLNLADDLSSAGGPVSGKPWDLVANATDLYFTDYDAGTVNKVPLGGGALTAISSGEQQPYGIAIDDDYVYWSNEGSGVVLRQPLAGGANETVAGGQSQPTYLALDGEFIYWTNYSNNTVMRSPIDSSAPPLVLATDQSAPFAIAVDATHVYWTNFSGGTIARVAK